MEITTNLREKCFQQQTSLAQLKKLRHDTNQTMAKNYCFTSFTMSDCLSVWDAKTMNYICWGNEVCPTTQRKHIQGWVQFAVRTRFNRALQQLGGKVALFVCRGTVEQNEKYCRKDNEFECRGMFTTQGERNDLATIAKELCDITIPLETIAERNPGDWIRYFRGFREVRNMAAKRATTEWRKLTTSVYAGPTGTGKTRTALEGGGFLIHGDSLQWWDGYAHETKLIIDEYSNQIPITKLLNLLDGYQLRLPVKGGFTYANWTTVIITTNLDALHDQAKEAHQRALERRITTWKHFEEELYGSDG